MNPLHPGKLLLTKWTAAAPVARERHFIVRSVLAPVAPRRPIEWVDVEAIISGSIVRIPWRQLRDTAQWRQGWV